MIAFTIIVLLLIEIFAWNIYKDLLCPAVLHNIFWVISIIGTLTFGYDIILNKIALLVIVLGSLIFQFGFYLSLRTTINTTINTAFPRKHILIVKPSTLKALIIVLLIIAIPVLIQYYQYIKYSNIPLYDLLKNADGDLHLPGLFDYYRKFVQLFSLSSLLAYWKLESPHNVNIKKYVFILFILAVLCVISIPTRNGILWFILPLFIIYATTHSLSNKKILITGLSLVFGFLLIFYFISFGKYWYLYENDVDKSEVLFKEIKIYLSDSIPAFCNNISQNDSIYQGKNTFRILFAISDKITGSSTAHKLTNEFVSLGNGLTTNVFTFYDFYLRDFGIPYALLAQFIVACFHGVNYKWMRRGRLYKNLSSQAKICVKW
jgi:oligosaccharide repeat unit polymerase